MSLPYTISTLLYGFNTQDDVLLHRMRPPNQGLWSPPGGKLMTATGESPYACACREAREEVGVDLCPRDLHLTGIVSEQGYEGSSHWLMFLFEIKPRLMSVPPPHPEGSFAFVSKSGLGGLSIPHTDRERIWPLFWNHRGGFFSAHCRTMAGGPDEWIEEESCRSASVPLSL